MATRLDYGRVALAPFHHDPVPHRSAASRSPTGVDGVQRSGRSLSDLIESEIIPRLINKRPEAARIEGSSSITAADIDAFVPLTLQIEADALIDRAEILLDRGVSVESLLVDLLAPVARVLGEYWKSDRCDFVDVTMGLWRLQEVVHEIAARGVSHVDRTGRSPRALFSALPGDQHGFGAIVVEEMFTRAGWITDRMGDPSLPDLYERLGSEWFDMIGLTVSCDCHTATLPAIIVALRNVSRNPRLVVMVGGRLFSEDPSLAATVGADGTAGDAHGAVAIAAALVEARTSAAA